MKTLLMENKKLKVVLEIDQESRMCLSSSGDIKYFDDGLLMKTFYDLKEAKKTGVYYFKFTAISEMAYQKILRRDDNWIKKQNSNILNGGVFTMLKNKGYEN